MKHKQVMTLLLALAAVSMQAQTRQQLRDSLAYYSGQVMRRPHSADLRLRKASYNLQLEQWQYAKDEYDAVLKSDPQNLAALFYRAYANERLSLYKLARRDYEALLYVVPRHFEARLGLALLNQKDNRPTEAMDGINMLISQYPDSAVAYAARAGMETERGMYAPAEFDLTKAVELDPDNTDYIINRVNVRLLLGRKSDAREDLDAMLRLGVPKAALKEWYDKCR